MSSCEHCSGTGIIETFDYHVTADMASDAGDPSIEGVYLRSEFIECSTCSGSGEEPDAFLVAVQESFE